MDDENLLSKTLFTVHSHRDLFLCDEHNADFFVSGESQTYAADDNSTLAIDVQDDHGQEQDITPAPLPEMLPFLRVTTDHEPIDARIGFVFGSDPAVSDVLLDKDPTQGISKKQFAIQVNQENGVLLLRNHSRNKTNVRSRSLGKLALRHQRALQENDSVHVPLGLYDIEIRLPDHSAHRRDYHTHLSKFITKISSQIPVLRNLELASGPSASTVSSRASPYQLQDKVGSGAYGDVYQAVHQVTGDVVAVKQLGKEKDMRLEEAMLLRSITHEHIVKFHAFIIESDSLLLVMELVHGRNLEQEFKASCPSSTELREAIRQQLKAAESIHHRGIVHRDIKPPNVMVMSRYPMVTKLTDFGLAITLAELADKASCCGTAAYAAPEILEKAYNEKVDIWSLGIILLRYSHKLPSFPKVPKGPADWRPWRNWPDKVRQHLQSMPSSPASQFISVLLTPNPAARPSAKEALSDPFFSARFSKCSTEETANAALSGDELVAEDTIRASSVRQGPQETASWNLPDTEIPRHATAVLGNETGSNPPERHTKRQKNGQDPSLSEAVRFLDNIDDPLESLLFGAANQRATSERVDTKVSRRASYEEASELPSFRWNAQEQRDLTRDASQNTPREDEEQDVFTNQYELNPGLTCPPVYTVMRYNKQWIGYHPQWQRVNITSLLALGKVLRCRGFDWIAKKHCDATILKGAHYIQGSYILLDDATMCCADLRAGLASTIALRVIRSDITNNQAQNSIGIGPSEPPRHFPPLPCDPAPRFQIHVGRKSVRFQPKNRMVHALDICRVGGKVSYMAVSKFLQNNPSIRKDWVPSGPNGGYYTNEKGANQLFKHFQLSSDVYQNLFREIDNHYR
ncbi:hypothetical protein CABS02_14200 [Colletotrichum abscissum]|uniref:non-specific serine/threonine protein kinase n=1 Tax=Colletotrichum abscissum TaxID=1671311 RepID=A0A9P9X1I7_9PEZI|nr:hypothetical protein CABS02_14200 [Colletotrichum abscissum]